MVKKKKKMLRTLGKFCKTVAKECRFNWTIFRNEIIEPESPIIQMEQKFLVILPPYRNSENYCSICHSGIFRKSHQDSFSTEYSRKKNAIGLTINDKSTWRMTNICNANILSPIMSIIYSQNFIRKPRPWRKELGRAQKYFFSKRLIRVEFV